jgi:hypothetical protein
LRGLQCSRLGFKPDGKAEWVAAIKPIYKKKGASGLWRLQKNHPHLYNQNVWLFGGLEEGYRLSD